VVTTILFRLDALCEKGARRKLNVLTDNDSNKPGKRSKRPIKNSLSHKVENCLFSRFHGKTRLKILPAAACSPPYIRYFRKFYYDIFYNAMHRDQMTRVKKPTFCPRVHSEYTQCTAGSTFCFVVVVVVVVGVSWSL
jgi:hypothetical protein